MDDLDRKERLESQEARTPVPDAGTPQAQIEGRDGGQGPSAGARPPTDSAQKRLKRQRRAAAQRRRLHNVLLAGAFLLVVVLFFVINLAGKDKDFSETENRNLAQKPALTWSGLADGSLFSGLGDYVTDQFFLRDGWMSLKLKAETAMGRKDASGVYLGQDGYLLSAPEMPDQDALSRSLNAINSFSAKHSEISTRMMLVPGAAAILTDKLPKNAPVRDQLQDIAGIESRITGPIQFLDVASALQAHSEEYIYYKTDHHWTSLGASYAFSACAGQLGISSPVSYESYTVTDSFEGTLSSKSGSHKEKDSIQVYAPLGTDVSYYVSYPDAAEKVCSLFQRECLENKDKYTVFFGGNYSKVEIDTTAGNGRVLLLFKDSYANSFVQFLYPYYEKIIMIDPRYYYDDLGPILSSEGVTDILFLYSADTFLTDTALADVLEAENEAAAQTMPTGETEASPQVSPEASPDPAASAEETGAPETSELPEST